MALTERATQFLERQEWRADAVKSLPVIEKAFKRIGLLPSKALLDFQLRYGGLMIYVGLEPICFGILHGKLSRGDFQIEKKVGELIHWKPDDEISSHRFTCADTLYQAEFTLDEAGGYYEDGELRATHFDKIFEDLAVFDQITQAGYKQRYRLYGERFTLPDEVLIQALILEPYPLFTPDIIFWGQNNHLCVRKSSDELIVFAKDELSSAIVSVCDNLMTLYTKAPRVAEVIATQKKVLPPSIFTRLGWWFKSLKGK